MQSNSVGFRVLRRYCLTLIELFIVISILALVGGLISINAKKAIDEQRFRTEVDLFLDTLRAAQDLMLVAGTDAHFIVKENGQRGIDYWLEISENKREWASLLKRSKRTLKAVHSVNFLEKNPLFHSEEGLDIRFLSGGTVMSKGIIYLSTHETFFFGGSRNLAICLRGYPHPLVYVPGEAAESSWKEDASYLERLTRHTKQEIFHDKEELQEKSEKTTEESKTSDDATKDKER